MLRHFEREKLIWDSSEKFILLALNSFVDGEGKCFPGQSRLAQMTGLSKRTVIRTIDTLEQKHILSRRRRAHGYHGRTTNEYSTIYKNLIAYQGSSPVSDDVTPGDTMAPSVSDTVSPGKCHPVTNPSDTVSPGMCHPVTNPSDTMTPGKCHPVTNLSDTMSQDLSSINYPVDLSSINCPGDLSRDESPPSPKRETCTKNAQSKNSEPDIEQTTLINLSDFNERSPNATPTVDDTPAENFSRKKNWSADELEPFRLIYNRDKPDSWKKCDKLTTARVKRINERVIAEYGDRALEVWRHAFSGAKQDRFYRTVTWTMDNLLSTGKNGCQDFVTSLAEAAVDVKTPAQQIAASFSKMPEYFQRKTAERIQEIIASGGRFR